jgi:lactocepin
MDGEYVPVSFSSEDLKDEEVFIIVDEIERHIYIWTGLNSSVRKRFISSQIARQIRLEKGMTYKVSTEEQGNETQLFTTMIERLAGEQLNATKTFDVSPVAFSTHPETLKEVSPVKKSIPAPTPEAVPTKAPTAAPTKAPTAAPTKAPTKVPTKASITEVKPKPISRPVEVSRPEILYFSEDEEKEINKAKAKMVISSTDKNMIISTIHISSEKTEGKIAFYYLPKTSKTASCKNKKPIFAVYLTSNTPPVIELDDLEIPIPAGNSIYYTCPANTFIGINLED